MNEKTNEIIYAGFWVRVASVVIDIFIIYVFVVTSISLTTIIAHPYMSSSMYLKFILFFFLGVSFIFTVLYFAWFNSNGRQSAGKKLFGIIVLDGSIQPISFSKSLLRAFIYLIDYIIFGIGHLLILFNKKKRALHDFVAQTIVIRLRPKKKFEVIVIIAVIIAFSSLGMLLDFFISANYVQAFRIPTGSLKPTLLLGDFILVDKFSPTNPDPKQSDWIAFKYPPNPELHYIKRCIATGSQTVEIKENNVYIDGKHEGIIEKIEQKYDPEDGRHIDIYKVISPQEKTYFIQYNTDNKFKKTSYGPVTIPNGHYFVLGDNRDNSADSRYWGFVPEKNIIGRGGMIYFSWDKRQNKIRWSRIGKVIK